MEARAAAKAAAQREEMEAKAQAAIAGALEEAKAKRDNQMACVVCMEAPKTHLFSPCNHLCVCVDCAALVMGRRRKCPICRAPAVAAEKVVVVEFG